ncbi:CubicO group peptidase, beta-lactamase class C family [Chitinophaga sp. CF118]|nr:CubicO group peptidase, beta-lactamase class C family [Chitinophaga sp. CF118]
MQIAYKRGIFNGNILIAQKGQIIYEKSLGFAEGSKNIPLTKDMKFDIGSISKEFNGSAILLLCQRGQLSLDDSLTRYFPAFPDWAKQVKIRHLINYTSGIPMLGPAADSTDPLIYNSLISLKALVAKPGTVYIYNHVNVFLQRLIIEKVSGVSYADFVRQNLLQPAGMNASLVDYPVDGPGMARAFDGAGNNTPYAQGTKGWIRLPVDDLYRWTQALHSYKIISPASLNILSENFPGGESSLGTTGFKDDKLIWHQHQGSNYNYEAAFYCDLPEGIAIVMMTNNQQMKVWSLKTTILNILHHQPFTVPRKSLYLTIRDRMLINVNEGLKYYQELKANGQDQYDFSFEIGDLISTGKYLQRRNKYDDAILVFQTAVQLKGRPEDVSYGYELIGECYRSKGDKTDALANYRKALEIFPQNKNASGMIAELTAQSGL